MTKLRTMLLWMVATLPPLGAITARAEPVKGVPDHRYAAKGRRFYTSKAHGVGLHGDPVRVAVLGGNSSFDRRVTTMAEQLGDILGEHLLPVSTGGGKGLPQIAQERAYEKGSFTVGFSPARSMDEHRAKGRPTKSLSLSYLTAAGSGAGIIEREGPLVQQNNVRLFINGNLGTLGELVASLHAPGVLGFLADSGGVAAAARSRILKHLGTLRADTRIVSEFSPSALVESSLEQLAELPEAIAFPEQLVHPVGPRSLLTASERGKQVFSFLAHENELSDAGLREWAHVLDGYSGDPRAHLAVIPKRDGKLSEATAGILRRKGADVVEIAAGGTYKEAQSGPVRYAGMGEEGIGEFMAQRQVVGDAKAIFVAGGDYKTLAGVIFGLHQRTVIGVLESGGLSSGLKEILSIADKNPGGATVLYDSDGANLYRRVAHALEDKTPSYGYGKRQADF